MELIPLAGSSSRGFTPGSCDQADILVVYAAAEGKGMSHQEAPLHRAQAPGTGVALVAAGAWHLWHRGNHLVAIRPFSFHVYYLQ